MPFVNISQVYAADPGAVWTPKRSFVSTEPFAIVMRAQVSQDVIDAGLRFDAYFQADNPRRDPWQGNWWSIVDGGTLGGFTRDHRWLDVPFQWGTDFEIHASWGQYRDFVNHILGIDRVNGVFVVRGTIGALIPGFPAKTGESLERCGVETSN
jgi:hypothetical protein